MSQVCFLKRTNNNQPKVEIEINCVQWWPWLILLFLHYIFICSLHLSCFVYVFQMIINTFQARLVFNVIAIPKLVLFEMSSLLFLHSMTTSSFVSAWNIHCARQSCNCFRCIFLYTYAHLHDFNLFLNAILEIDEWT